MGSTVFRALSLQSKLEASSGDICAMRKDETVRHPHMSATTALSKWASARFDKAAGPNKNRSQIVFLAGAQRIRLLRRDAAQTFRASAKKLHRGQ